MSCDSETAAKQSESARKEVLPIVAFVVLLVVLLMAVAVRSFTRIRNLWSQNEERIMVSTRAGGGEGGSVDA